MLGGSWLALHSPRRLDRSLGPFLMFVWSFFPGKTFLCNWRTLLLSQISPSEVRFDRTSSSSSSTTSEILFRICIKDVGVCEPWSFPVRETEFRGSVASLARSPTLGPFSYRISDSSVSDLGNSLRKLSLIGFTKKSLRPKTALSSENTLLHRCMLTPLQRVKSSFALTTIIFERLKETLLLLINSCVKE
jgi:hypothetical protein